MNRSFLCAFVAIAGIASAIAIQNHDNYLVQKECNGPIKTVATTDTGIGPVYRCTYSVRMQGPSSPIKD
jgi:hypothetical protein